MERTKTFGCSEGGAFASDAHLESAITKNERTVITRDSAVSLNLDKWVFKRVQRVGNDAWTKSLETGRANEEQ